MGRAPGGVAGEGAVEAGVHQHVAVQDQHQLRARQQQRPAAQRVHREQQRHPRVPARQQLRPQRDVQRARLALPRPADQLTLRKGSLQAVQVRS